MLLLAQFLYRLSFGMAAAMAVTPPKLVTSGYYRNNLYVLLGMNTLAALVAWNGFADSPPNDLQRYPALIAALLSYFGSAVWLYEKPRAGITMLALTGVVTLVGALSVTPIADKSTAYVALAYADTLAAGLLLGSTMAAMLLGHWYLNAPGMKITPLFKLTAAMGVALLLRVAVSAIGLSIAVTAAPVLGSAFESAQWFMLALRWIAGVFGTAGLIWMTWTTLKIPNTQAATGMLYVAVIMTFLGELLGQLLSVGRHYPL